MSLTKKHARQLDRMRERLVRDREALDAMSDHYRGKFDNASERWQSSDAGQACDGLADALYEAAAALETAEGDLQEIVNA